MSSFVNYLKTCNESTLSGNIASVDSKLSKKPIKRDLPKNGIDFISEESLSDEIIVLLNKNNMKVKVVNPTPFGLVVDFFKSFDLEEIKDLLSDLDIEENNIKAKGLSIFIEIE